MFDMSCTFCSTVAGSLMQCCFYNLSSSAVSSDGPATTIALQLTPRLVLHAAVCRTSSAHSSTTHALATTTMLPRSVPCKPYWAQQLAS